MNPAKTIQKKPLKFGDDPILPLEKIQNDPILPNPAKTVPKNLLKFADDPFLPLYMNQAKTI